MPRLEPPQVITQVTEKPGPRLLWSSLAISRINVRPEDREAFPEWWEILDRKRLHEENFREDSFENDYPPYHLRCFVQPLEEAQRRIWILDPHFDAIGARSLHSAFYVTHVKNVRIISTRREGREKWLRELTLARGSEDLVGNRPASDLQWIVAAGNADVLHDRFAIVDDELWHFGSTVGGGYPFLTAVSRGWDAGDHEGGTKACQFYRRLWKDLTGRDIEEKR